MFKNRMELNSTLNTEIIMTNNPVKILTKEQEALSPKTRRNIRHAEIMRLIEAPFEESFSSYEEMTDYLDQYMMRDRLAHPDWFPEFYPRMPTIN